MGLLSNAYGLEKNENNGKNVFRITITYFLHGNSFIILAEYKLSRNAFVKVFYYIYLLRYFTTYILLYILTRGKRKRKEEKQSY